MKQEYFFPSADGITRIHVVEWIPEVSIRAILQISHGMAEYIDRYDRFARYLNQYGFYVVGNDHLGHGASVVSPEKHGYFIHPNGNECVIDDLHTLRTRTAERFPGIPYFLLGHSMGSFLARQYLMLHGKGLSGAIIMGTGSQPEAALTAGLSMCTALARIKGWEYRSPAISGLCFGAYNRRIPGNRTVMDWLTRDERIVDQYVNDPWCGYMFTLDGYYQLFRTIRFIQDRNNIRRLPRNCPMLLVSGEEDPVGNYGKDVRQIGKTYRAAGVTDLTVKLYPGDRHEVLNEKDYGVVFDDLRLWLEERIK